MRNTRSHKHTIVSMRQYVMMPSKEHAPLALRQQPNITTDVKGLRQCGYTDL